MFSLTIVFGPGPSVWTLLFKTAETAETATKKMEEIGTLDGAEMITIADDYGQNAAILRSTVHGVMFEDMEQSKLAHIERALHQARVHAKGTELAQADPVLRQAARQAQGGMPILSPGMAPAQNGRWPS